MTILFAGPSIFLESGALEEVSVITNDFGVGVGRASGLGGETTLLREDPTIFTAAGRVLRGVVRDSHTNQEKNPVFGFCAPVNPAAGVQACWPQFPSIFENKFGGFDWSVNQAANKAWFFFNRTF